MSRPRGGYRVGELTVPSVTTVISRYKDSGPLLYWAFEQGKAAERGEIESLYDKRDEAADAGTLAHQLVQAHLESSPAPDLSEYPEDIAAQAMQGYENYLKWERSSTITILYQEIPLVSSTYGYGGTIDAVGTDVDGNMIIIDWKTSNSVYLDYRIQLAAYGHLWRENYPDQPITGGYHLCRFSKSFGDFSHHYWSDLSGEWEYFLILLEAFKREKILKKRS